MIRRWILVGGLALSAVAALTLAGCYKSEPAPGPAGEPKPEAGKPDDHEHKPGAHGGIIVPLGRDSYHVEAVFEKGGVVRLYTLGKDEARIQEVDVQELVGFVTPLGSSEAEQLKFSAQPQPGDSPGMTSQFTATLPPEFRGKPVQVTINNIQIGTERFRLAFTNEKAGHAEAMPARMGTEKEQKVFLSPGGMYTEADIRANGNAVPSVKYADVDVVHQDTPQPGEKICPISKTKSNPKLTWVVGGNTYEFCCPPCLQEFVEKAKKNPAEILPPDAYRAKREAP